MTCITLISAVGLIWVESVATAAADGVAAVNIGTWATATKRARPRRRPIPRWAHISSLRDCHLRVLVRPDVVASSGSDGRAKLMTILCVAQPVALRWISRDTEEARQALLRAERLSTRRPAGSREGWLRWQLGDLGLAESLRCRLAAAPTLLIDPYWEVMPPRGGLAIGDRARTRTVEATALGDPSRVAQLFRFDVLSGDYASAGEMLEEFQPRTILSSSSSTPGRLALGPMMLCSRRPARPHRTRPRPMESAIGRAPRR